MTRDEMLAGLREAADWAQDEYTHGTGDYSVLAAQSRAALRAAITALESAPSQVEAPSSESARDDLALTLRAVDYADRLRAELEQARDDVAAVREERDVWIEAHDELKQERDAALAKVAALTKVAEAAREHVAEYGGMPPLRAALAELDKEQDDGK